MSNTAADTTVTGDQIVTSETARKLLALLRICFGLTFLWAFFDKLLALGFATGSMTDPKTGVTSVDRFGDAAWIHGGSPTFGFLKFGAAGPFKGLYNSIAGAGWADFLFMMGLLGIGLALTFGFGMRLAGIFGAVLYRLIIFFALQVGLDPNDMKLITAALVVAALLLPRWGFLKKIPSLRGRGGRVTPREPEPAVALTAGVGVVAAESSGANSGAQAQGERN